MREVHWREEQPLLNCWSDFMRPEEYGLAYRAAYARARAAAEKEAAEVLPLAEAVAPLRFLEEVLAQRSQRAAAEEREAQARYEVLLAKAEVLRKQLQVALEAAQAEAAPELREESRVLAVKWRVFRMEDVDLREAESAAKARRRRRPRRKRRYSLPRGAASPPPSTPRAPLPPPHAGLPPNATPAGGGGGGRLEQVRGQSSFLVARPHPPGAAGSMVRGGCHVRGAGRCGRHGVPVGWGLVR